MANRSALLKKLECCAQKSGKGRECLSTQGNLPFKHHFLRIGEQNCGLQTFKSFLGFLSVNGKWICIIGSSPLNRVFTNLKLELIGLMNQKDRKLTQRWGCHHNIGRGLNFYYHIWDFIKKWKPDITTTTNKNIK